jgi:hypothetical protein
MRSKCLISQYVKSKSMFNVISATSIAQCLAPFAEPQFLALRAAAEHHYASSAHIVWWLTTCEGVGNRDGKIVSHGSNALRASRVAPMRVG